MSKHLPSNWKKVRFGDMAQIVADRIDNPRASGLEHYIGLEHLDSDEIRIKRYGSPDEVEATKFLCKKGDIIFGKRRAYLRKVAISGRDAVVSAHSMVLRARPEEVFPDFLPLFMHSSQFWKTAFAVSEGSLSPTIKWKTLAAQEFFIPSYTEQKSIAKILWALEENREMADRLVHSIERFRETLRDELLTRGIGHKRFKEEESRFMPREWSICKLASLCKERKEKSYPPHSNKMYVGLEHMDSNNLAQEQYQDSEQIQSIANIFRKGDLLYGKLRPYLNKAAVATFDGICTSEILVIEHTPETTNDFLLLHFKSKSFVEFNNHYAYGTKMPRTSYEILSQYSIGLPSIKEQLEIVQILQDVEEFLQQCKSSMNQAMKLKKRLANALLSGELLLQDGVLI